MAAPISFANIGNFAINVTDIIMIGRISVQDLAAVGLASAIYSFFFLACMGFVEPAVPLAAQAYGASQPHKMRQVIQQGLWVAITVSSLFILLLCYLEFFLTWLNQDPDLIEIAVRYMHFFMWCLPLATAILALRGILIVLKRSVWLLWITWGCVILNTFLDWVLIFGHLGFPALGVTGAAVASILVFVVMLSLLLGVIYFREPFNQYSVLSQLWKPDWPIYFRFFRLGVPIGLQFWLMEGLLVAVALLAGLIGPHAIAAHTVALNLVIIGLVVSVGLMDTAAVRVGIHYGRRNIAGIRRVISNVLFLAFMWSLIVAGLFWGMPNQLAALYLNPTDPAADQTLSLIPVVLLIAGFFLIIESSAAVINAALRGMSDVKIPLLIIVVMNWGGGFLSVAVLGFVFNQGLAGIWWGLLIGIVCKWLGYTYRFHVVTHRLDKIWSDSL